MESAGNLNLRWAQGYSGSDVTFVSGDTFLYKCGNVIKFQSVVSGEESVFPYTKESCGPVAAHGHHSVFAVADTGIKPNINVFRFPSFETVSTLEGGAELEFQHLAFSSSEYLVSISGIPDFKLMLWHYEKGTCLCVEEMHGFHPDRVTVNPGNWRNICLSSASRLDVWNIEQSNTTCVIKQQEVRLPCVDPSVEDAMGGGAGGAVGGDKPGTRASTRMGRATVTVPHNAVAGVMGEDAKRFSVYQDELERCVPVAHCWMPSGHVLIGCKKGQLLKIDCDEFRITMLYNATLTPDSLLTTTIEPSSDSLLDRHKSSLSNLPEEAVLMSSGSFNSLALHKSGLMCGGSDGYVRLLDITGDKVTEKDKTSITAPVSEIVFNPSHDYLAIGSSQGDMYAISPTQMSELNLLLNIRSGDFIAVGVLCPGNELCVSAREQGDIQVWNAANGKLVSSYSLGMQITCMSCCPTSHVVAIGDVSGYVYFVDFTALKKPRIVHRSRLYQNTITHLCYNYTGQLLLSGSNENHVFVVDGRASKSFQTVGYVDVPGDIKGIATLYDDKSMVTKVVVATNTTPNTQLGATKIVQFDLPGDINEDISNKYDSLKGNLRQDIINSQTFTLSIPSYGISVAPGSVAYTISQASKNLMKLALPTERTKKDSILQSLGDFPCHQLEGGKLLLAPHERWLASCGGDGLLTVRAVGALDKPIDVFAHDFSKNGIRDFAFSLDANHIFTCGNDGVLACFTWDLSQKGKQAVQAAESRYKNAVRSLQSDEAQALSNLAEWEPAMSASRPGSGIEKAEQEQTEKEEGILKAIEHDMIFTTPTPTPSLNATWLEIKELEALKEDERKYADTKKDLRMEIRDIRRMLKGMMSENETVTDIERLGHHEFDLDVEEQKRLQREGEEEVARIREEREFDNLAKTYLADLIKKECWDSMEVKGRGIVAFNSNLEVSNYPMKARTREELERLEDVTNQRKIEKEDAAVTKEFANVTQKHSSATELKLTIEDKFNFPHEVEEVEPEETEQDGKEQPSTTGSLEKEECEPISGNAEQYGGSSEYVYSQFELHARSQKMNQIILLQDVIHRIKKHFNEEFDKTFAKKEQEISKIKEKNKRIYKILDDLNMAPDVYEPELGSIEKPEMLLTVADSEVKVEKYLTTEQQRQIEEDRVAEEERQAREKGDNWRGRGLDRMMGGVLEVKREDELKKDIPVPLFMQQKEEEDWTDEEKKLAVDYHKKCADLEEEREKYHKQLEQELRKLQAAITEGTQAFDDVILQLFYRKVKTEMVIYQEELKILRLKNSLLVEEELANHLTELHFDLDHKKSLKQLTHDALKLSRDNCEQFKESYDNLVAEDKLLEKEFRREFLDAPGHIVDQLFRLFKKRPKGQKARDVDNPAFKATSGNPFFQRPPTATQNAIDRRVHENVLRDMDSESHMPENCEEYIWQRFCGVRRRKIDSEYMVKQKALILADMQSFQNKRQYEDDKYREDIDEILVKINKLREDRNRFMINLEIQLLLKQGQVEVDAGPFIHSFSESLLLHRSVVEDLNHRIRQLGEVKIDSMLESKEFRKNIVQLEWEHKRMKMEMEDLQKKRRDIQNLKVTREIQAFLNEEDHDAKKAQEIQSLEQTIVAQKQHHEKHVEEKKKTIRELKRTIKEKSQENASMTDDLTEINVSVNERRHIHEVNADKLADAGAEKRYRDIVERRKLVDLAKAQAQEVAVLRAEVERLRMRTFPALVQVEH